MEYIKNFNGVSFEYLHENIWLVRGHEPGKSFGDAFGWGFVLITGREISFAKMLICKDSGIKQSQVRGVSEFLKSVGCAPKVTWERKSNSKVWHSAEYDK